LRRVTNKALRSYTSSILSILIVASIGAWFIVKPVRALFPTWVGMVCPNDQICLDKAPRSAEAQALYDEAITFVSNGIGTLQGSPKVVFCSTDTCAENLGLGKRSAVTIGSWVTVIGPRAWKPYYVRHELIHVLQSQRLGELSLMRKPQWFKEGMAYSLSEDPRRPLAEPFESERAQFELWYHAAPVDQLWMRAVNL
jgi:hypothetical protein